MVSHFEDVAVESFHAVLGFSLGYKLGFVYLVGIAGEHHLFAVVEKYTYRRYGVFGFAVIEVIIVPVLLVVTEEVYLPALALKRKVSYVQSYVGFGLGKCRYKEFGITSAVFHIGIGEHRQFFLIKVRLLNGCVRSHDVWHIDIVYVISVKDVIHIMRMVGITVSEHEIIYLPVCYIFVQIA